MCADVVRDSTWLGHREFGGYQASWDHPAALTSQDTGQYRYDQIHIKSVSKNNNVKYACETIKKNFTCYF